jgi:hypothetical protein
VRDVRRLTGTISRHSQVIRQIWAAVLVFEGIEAVREFIFVDRREEGLLMSTCRGREIYMCFAQPAKLSDSRSSVPN